MPHCAPRLRRLRPCPAAPPGSERAAPDRAGDPTLAAATRDPQAVRPSPRDLRPLNNARRRACPAASSPAGAARPAAPLAGRREFADNRIEMCGKSAQILDCHGIVAQNVIELSHAIPFILCDNEP